MSVPSSTPAPIWSPWSAACSPPKTRLRSSAPTSPSSRNAQEIRMNHDQSHALFSRAQQLLPGGVNSPVRAFKSVGGEPFFVERADGAYLYDVDGNRYIDFCLGDTGAMFGHSPP
eukprot:850574_1